MYPYSGFAARNLAGVAHGAAPAYFDPFEAALVFAVIRPPAGPHRMTSASPGIVGGRAGLADGHAVSVREGFRVDRPAVFDIQPQPQQIALAMFFGVVVVGGARVQNDAVVQQLNVSGPQVHAQLQVVARGMAQERLQSLVLGRAQGDPSLLLGRIDVFDDRRAAAQIALEPAVDRADEIGWLPTDFLAAPIEEKVAVEQAEQRRFTCQHLVVDRRRTDDDALPAFFRRAQAKKPDNVNHVGMKFKVGPGLVAADVAAAAIFGIAAIEDMAEPVGSGVLRARRANMRADAAVEQSRLLVSITVDR